MWLSLSCSHDCHVTHSITVLHLARRVGGDIILWSRMHAEKWRMINSVVWYTTTHYKRPIVWPRSKRYCSWIWCLLLLVTWRWACILWCICAGHSCVEVALLLKGQRESIGLSHSSIGWGEVDCHCHCNPYLCWQGPHFSTGAMHGFAAWFEVSFGPLAVLSTSPAHPWVRAHF